MNTIVDLDSERRRRRHRPKDQVERFWSKVTSAPADECWLWRPALNSRGYGVFSFSVNCVTTREMAHRFAYRNLIGEIPDGLILDHECRVHACVNPWHLDPVTYAVNVHRGKAMQNGQHNRDKSHCRNGHEYSFANTSVNAQGHRRCRTCANQQARARRANP